MFSNTNFSIKEIRQNDIIIIDWIFPTVSSIIAPQTRDNILTVLIDFQLVDENKAFIILPRGLSYTKTEMQIANQQTFPRNLSFSTAITRNFNNLSRSNNTYKVKLEYFNGQTWIKDKIAIDKQEFLNVII